ncbi:unnamed protein product, partial [Aureobasidium pullulans]
QRQPSHIFSECNWTDAVQGLDKDLKTDPPCHPRACAIQGMMLCLVSWRQPAHAVPDCIQKNGYDESKCQKQNGDSASTVSCPKAGLLRLKMRQRAQGIK